MIRTTPQRRFHVSNRAALVAALVLAITAFTGLYDSGAFDGSFKGQTAAADSQVDNNSSTSASSKRKVSISLLLFGRG